jgi:tRNA-dependent cyclodipeptide synthase
VDRAKEISAGTAKLNTAFVPISLGNHYYSSAILRRIKDEIIDNSSRSAVFICDRLRSLSYQIQGETNTDHIDRVVRLQCEQFRKMLAKIGIASDPNHIVVDWSYLNREKQYSEFVLELDRFIEGDQELRKRRADYVAQQLAHHSVDEGIFSQDAIGFQKQYITEETALSLYMTEIKGFNVELYRRGMGFVDYIYGHKPDDLKRFLARSELRRQFVSLEALFGWS